MPAPVKVSDTLLALAKEEARAAHRSATAQIEHWASLGRAVEAIVAYRDVLALKRAGETLPIPRFVGREEVDETLRRVLENPDRSRIRARIRAGGGPIYASDPDHPGGIVEVRPDGMRIAGELKGRKFVARRKSVRRRP